MIFMDHIINVFLNILVKLNNYPSIKDLIMITISKFLVMV